MKALLIVGIEHTFAQQTFILEMQMIHVKDTYDASNITKASENGSNDTFAILSVFFQEQRSDNAHLKNLTDALDSVKAKDNVKPFTGGKLEQLLPRNTDGFLRYNGSLTFPNCAESVTWTLFKVMPSHSNRFLLQSTIVDTMNY